MAPSAPIVAALFRLSSADLDEQSMLQMPVVQNSVETDASDCACPGYYQEKCEENAFQGCRWTANDLGHHSQGWTDRGESNAPWCQCDPDFVPTPPLFQPVCCEALLASCRSCQLRVSVEVFCAENPGYAGCPEEPTCCEALTASCRSCQLSVSVEDFCAENPGYAGCPEEPTCCQALTASCRSCQLSVSIEEFCEGNPGYDGCPEVSPPVCASEWVAPGKGCPSGNCLNGNTPYDTLEEAWAQCEQVNECGNILEWTNGNFYLRRDTDPDVAAGTGRTLAHCPGLSPPEFRSECGSNTPGAVSPGKGCPVGGSCLNDNTPYNTLQEAWAQCEQISNCGNILMWTNGRYYLRRDTDPDVTTGLTMPFCRGLSSAPEARDTCGEDRAYQVGAVSPGKGCPSGNCLNGNTPYNTLEEAWAQCEQVSGCGNILHWTDGNYYLRRATDPDVTQGSTVPFCLGLSSAPRDNAQAPAAVCPEGWEQQGEIGADVGGCGLQSCDERYDIDSEAACAARCDENDACIAFSYAPMNGDRNHPGVTACTIYSSDTPTGTWTGTEGIPTQVFCSRPADDHTDAQPFPVPAVIRNAHNDRRIFAQSTSAGEGGVGAANGGELYADQKWIISIAGAGDGVYTITNEHSGRRLFAQHRNVGGVHEAGVGADNGETTWADQTWYFDEQEDGKYVIRNVYSDRRLFAQIDKYHEDGFGASDGDTIFADQKWYIDAA